MMDAGTVVGLVDTDDIAVFHLASMMSGNQVVTKCADSPLGSVSNGNKGCEKYENNTCMVHARWQHWPRLKGRVRLLRQMESVDGIDAPLACACGGGTSGGGGAADNDLVDCPDHRKKEVRFIVYILYTPFIHLHCHIYTHVHPRYRLYIHHIYTPNTPLNTRYTTHHLNCLIRPMRLTVR